MRGFSSSGGQTLALVGTVEERRMTFVLKNGTNTVGRREACDVKLSSPGVSERHAVVEVLDGAIDDL